MAERHMTERTVGRKKNNRKDIWPKYIRPKGHLAERTNCRKSRRNGYLTETKFDPVNTGLKKFVINSLHCKIFDCQLQYRLVLMYENYVLVFYLYNIAIVSNKEMPNSILISRYQKGNAKVKMKNNK